MKTTEELVRYLLDNGWLDPVAVVTGNLTVVSGYRRHRWFRVTGIDDGGLFVKQADPSLPETRSALRAEARFYASCNESGREALSKLIPRLLSYDPGPDILILEALARPSSLHSVLRSPDGDAAPLLSRLGQTVASVHNERGYGPTPGGIDPPSVPPWILRMHRPGADLLCFLNPAVAELVRRVQADGRWTRGLERAGSGWSEEGLIHGDLRAENVLLDGEEAPRIRVVDWEFVGAGDPAWDVGRVLHDVLEGGDSDRHELFAGRGRDVLPRDAGGRAPRAREEGGAAGPWELARAFWSGYFEARPLGPDAQRDLMARAVGYVAVHRLQDLLETCQTLPHLTPVERRRLDLAARFLDEPTDPVVRRLWTDARRRPCLSGPLARPSKWSQDDSPPS